MTAPKLTAPQRRALESLARSRHGTFASRTLSVRTLLSLERLGLAVTGWSESPSERRPRRNALITAAGRAALAESGAT